MTNSANIESILINRNTNSLSYQKNSLFTIDAFKDLIGKDWCVTGVIDILKGTFDTLTPFKVI